MEQQLIKLCVKVQERIKEAEEAMEAANKKRQQYIKIMEAGRIAGLKQVLRDINELI